MEARAEKNKNIQDFNRTFQKSLEALNASQREAVEQIDGPVMVIAGPGTGKTHILASRIGCILTETDTQPHNILCLTFTEAGVLAMRKRLLQLIGPESQRVHIFTFHGFCNRVIKENADQFGRNELETLSDLERVEILQKILYELSPLHLLTMASDPDFYVPHLQDLFQKMKSEAWTVDFVIQKIRLYLSELPTRDEFIYKRKTGEFQKGDLKIGQLAAQEKKMSHLVEAVQLFPRYEQLLEAARRYDFDDMVGWVLAAFQKNELLLRLYQEQYLYIMVDEFQDTNGSQNALIQMLTNYWDSPNIFIVGDDDQAIYEFQGARLKSLTDFYEQYRTEIKLVVLQENYRSTQAILDFSKKLISHNNIRIVNYLKGVTKELSAANAKLILNKKLPQVAVYQNIIQEANDVTEQIKRLQEAGTNLSEIAIIYNKHRQADIFIRLLEQKNISYQTKKPVNILTEPLVQQFLDALHYIEAEFVQPYSGEAILYRLCYLYFWNISALDIAKISLFINQKNSEGTLVYWRDVMADDAVLTSLNIEKKENIIKFVIFFQQLIVEAANLPVQILVERLLNRSGWLAWLMQQPDKVWNLQLLNTLFDFLHTETTRNPNLRVADFLKLLRNMNDHKLHLPIQKTLENSKGVTLMTAHSSKGLEFEHVFIVDVLEDTWGGNGSVNKHFSLPDTLTFAGVEDETEARRRLFYVALTRAKHSLKISYSSFSKQNKEQRRLVLLDEILENNSIIPLIVNDLEENELLETHQLLLSEQENSPNLLPDEAMLAALLEGFTLSLTTLNSYLRCPLSFYYESVLRLPAAISSNAVFGEAMHETMDFIAQKILSSKEKMVPDVTKIKAKFEQALRRRHARLSQQDYDRRLEIGLHTLQKYCEIILPTWGKIIHSEISIQYVEISGVPIKGTIDKIELQKDGTAHLVDYKTGKEKKEKMRAIKAKEEGSTGGDYWRQLYFYKILYEASRVRKANVTSGEIFYIEPDAQQNFISLKLVFKEEEELLVKKIMVETYQKIRRHEFQKGCGKPNCYWCKFANQYQATPDSFNDGTAEELDDD